VSITVLLVDDHAIVRDGLRALLEMKDDIAVVGDAADGRAAVKEAQRLNPDVVIMDINMPNRNGIEATQQLHDAGVGSKVIVLSMHWTSEHIYRALQAGARGYVLKDSAAAELVAAVRCVHAGKRYLSAQVAEAVVDDYVRDGKPASPLEALSGREREILQLTAEGRTSVEMGAMLFLSPKTIETYRSRLMQKIGVTDVPALVKFALQHGVIALQ
jgi:DNA-binding NarL/FixJ family response regulator